jgi:hypothetical protein
MSTHNVQTAADRNEIGDALCGLQPHLSTQAEYSRSHIHEIIHESVNGATLPACFYRLKKESVIKNGRRLTWATPTLTRSR